MSMQEREHPSTYFVQDRSSQEEMERLRSQDSMLTTAMGGVLPEQEAPTSFQRVLDVGCGTGGWLIEAAKQYPGMTRLVGVDISKKMIEYAREQASAQHLEDRVTFHEMDALRRIDVQANSFDLVNQRLGMSYLRTWDWPNLLHEYQRVSRVGGVIRLTESSIPETSSSALQQLNGLLLTAFHQAGHYFTPDQDGVINHLTPLMQRFFLNVQMREYLLELHAGTDEGLLFAQDIARGYRTFVPFLRKWTIVPDDYEQMYQQALVDMQQPDFVVTWHWKTVWGTCLPKRKSRSDM